MDQISDEMLQAYLDNELDGNASREVAEALAVSPELRQREMELRDLMAECSWLFAPVSAEDASKLGKTEEPRIYGRPVEGTGSAFASRTDVEIAARSFSGPPAAAGRATPASRHRGVSYRKGVWAIAATIAIVVGATVVARVSRQHQTTVAVSSDKGAVTIHDTTRLNARTAAADSGASIRTQRPERTNPVATSQLEFLLATRTRLASAGIRLQSERKDTVAGIAWAEQVYVLADDQKVVLEITETGNADVGVRSGSTSGNVRAKATQPETITLDSSLAVVWTDSLGRSYRLRGQVSESQLLSVYKLLNKTRNSP
jgi:anti-sigma factor RsiW